MIIINLFLDILVNNLTIFNTYFILTNIYNLPLKYLSLLIGISFFIDLFITHTYFLNLIILISSYFLIKYGFKHKKGILKNIFLNTLIYIFYIFSLYLYFNYQNINLLYIGKYLLFNYPLYFIYVLLSYKLGKKA